MRTFMDRLTEIGDNAVARVIALTDPVDIGKCSAEIVVAGWFRDHYPATYDQVQAEILSISLDVARRRSSRGIMQVAQYQCDFMLRTFIEQEDYRKATHEK